MTSKSASDVENSHQDDGYWSALFQQENSLSPSLVDPNPPTAWTEIESQLKNGRLPQTDAVSANKDPWRIAHQYYDEDKAVTLDVAGYNKGGLLVEWNNLQGFVPASQLLEFPQFHLESERLRALKQWQGKTLSLKIIEINRDLNRLILSERAALVDADERDFLLNRIKSGDKLQGEVTNLTKFGAFVDLGGIEGLIHISELSWSRVLHPSDIVKPGRKVRVLVLNVDTDKNRIALSLKRLKQDPWQSVEERFKPGQIIEGTVSNIVSFGAFVMIEDELEGLIHITELAEGSFLHPRDVVEKGDRVRARVLQVDGDSKRLALTMRNVDLMDHAS